MWERLRSFAAAIPHGRDVPPLAALRGPGPLSFSQLVHLSQKKITHLGDALSSLHHIQYRIAEYRPRTECGELVEEVIRRL